MPPRPPDEVAAREAGEWLARADEDLRVAELTLRASPPLLGSSAYHSQQAAEKALKAFLAARQVRFRLVHDLVELQTQCEQIDSEFARFFGMAQLLTPFATQFRYPGGPVAPEPRDAEEALRLASELVDFVRGRLAP